jgi:hypothetical protein
MESGDQWWLHFCRLLSQIWELIKAWHSATTFSLVREVIIVPFVMFVVSTVFTLGKNFYRPSVLLSRGRDVLRGFGYTLFTLIGLLAIVFFFALPVAIYQDHADLTKANKLLRNQNRALQDKPIPPVAPLVASTPTDPSLMKSGSVLALIGSLRGSIPRNANATFVVTAPDENRWIKQDLEALISEACSRGSTQLACFIEVAPIVPPPTQQGITVHVDESLSSGQALLIDTLPAALSTWFIIHKSTYLSETVRAKTGDSIEKTLIWIEVGNSSPWRQNDKRFKDGLSQGDIDNLDGWDVPLKQRLLAAAKDLGSTPQLRRFEQNPMYKSAVTNSRLVLWEAKRKHGLDIADAEKLLSAEHPDVSKIVALLTGLSDQLK